jgi:hypothetical protein
MNTSKKGRKSNIQEAMDLPEMDGKCAFLGSYVEDGETIFWFGDEYVCVAPRLVPTGKQC